MRMWNINPKLMCRQHLLGEHLEMHMFSGCLRKNISLNGYVKNGLVDLKNIKNRHNEITKEMIVRGYKPNKEKDKVFLLINNISGDDGKINIKDNLRELSERCRRCSRLIRNESLH